MTPLFLRKAKQLIPFLLLSFSSGIFAHDSIPKFDFAKHCKNADAYLLYSFTDVTYDKTWSGYTKYTSVNNKLVVNNSNGVDQFAYLNLSEYVSNNLYEIEVKTLKASGIVIELDSSQVFQRKSGFKRFGAINYPIPGVEPGDTIETKYVYSERPSFRQMTDFVNLYTNVPSLKSEYSIKSSSNLAVRYKGYNDFPEPEIVANDSLIYCVFSMEKIKGLHQNENTCLPCELPYMYYSMEKEEDEPRSWKDVYNQEFNVVTQPIAFDAQNASYYGRWKRGVIGEAKDSSKYHKFKLLHQDIMENMQMEAPKKSELLKSSGYFLKEKRMNPLSVRRLYRRMLEDLEIDYWAVFARSKRTGPIDPYYIRKGEFDHVFFAYKGDGEELNFLYPHDNYNRYQINEIPTSIYNSGAIITKPVLTRKIKKSDKFIKRNLELAEVDSVEVRGIKLPGTRVHQNYVKQIYYSTVDLEEKTIPTKYRFSVSGGMHTDLKSFFGMLNQDEEVSTYYDAKDEYEGNEDIIAIDTISEAKLKQEKPFGYTINAQGTLKQGVSFLNDSMASISLDKLIVHNQIESDQGTTDLSYYLDYCFTDYIMMIFKFPIDIDVLDIDSYNLDFKNDFGEYYFNLKMVGSNQITIQSNYKITKDKIPTNKYDALKELNEFVKNIKNRRIVVKLKK
ncbi:DUF3857 domain-containing protein [Flagellimonas algicola]|uniref:DUF3857 domain-containing protein n=1 Tax=Flagellimonas algicola TaxID=2583815 RepID=A0ABY2WM04_9FLAO|nr:DUF3857 domain-containing protein [Allomuricauda algicola]TMU55561.1 DUF3857 domain-containing protein [Allomuricauda algicola]